MNFGGLGYALKLAPFVAARSGIVGWLHLATTNPGSSSRPSCLTAVGPREVLAAADIDPVLFDRIDGHGIALCQ